MGTFQQLWRQPQRVWLRKALFQIHLWSGVGAGIYVLLISISGSVIVFRNEVYEKTESPIVMVEGAGARLSQEQILKAAQAAWPGYEVTQIYEFEANPKRAVEVRMEWRSWVRNRLFDPYTGKDLGNSVLWPIRTMAWFEDLHINLFGGKTGRQINAVGGGLLAILSLTGLAVWWPGIQNWTRGLWIRWRYGWKRFNWDIHSALGFWTLLLTFMWGVTGIFAAIPDPFRAAVDYLEPLRPIYQPGEPGTGGARGNGAVQRPEQNEQTRSPLPSPGGREGKRSDNQAASVPVGAERGTRGGTAAREPATIQIQPAPAGVPAPPGQGRRGRGRRPRFEPRIGDDLLRGAYALHFGNFAGVKVKIAWVILGLVPAVLFVTGLIMWINRVIRKLPSF